MYAANLSFALIFLAIFMANSIGIRFSAPVPKSIQFISWIRFTDLVIEKMHQMVYALHITSFFRHLMQSNQSDLCSFFLPWTSGKRFIYSSVNT
jgi:hypothetical protein